MLSSHDSGKLPSQACKQILCKGLICPIESCLQFVRNMSTWTNSWSKQNELKLSFLLQQYHHLQQQEESSKIHFGTNIFFTGANHIPKCFCFNRHLNIKKYTLNLTQILQLHFTVTCNSTLHARKRQGKKEPLPDNELPCIHWTTDCTVIFLGEKIPTYCMLQKKKIFSNLTKILGCNYLLLNSLSSYSKPSHAFFA
jgi:hypothetical protein